MRIATWNVNSLKACLEKVTWWLDRAKPDVLLMQETKLADRDAPIDVFRQAGYALAHHGQGQWNGVAIASRCGLGGVITNFGEPLRPARTPDIADDEPLAEARMISVECSGIRIVCVYAPNGRIVGSPFYEAKLAWFDRLAGWLNKAIGATTPAVLGGDFNVAPEDVDVWDPRACHGGTMTGSWVPYVNIFGSHVEIAAKHDRCCGADGLVQPSGEPIEPCQLGLVKRRAHDPAVGCVDADNADAAAFYGDHLSLGERFVVGN